jgi:hypothetical protein
MIETPSSEIGFARAPSSRFEWIDLAPLLGGAGIGIGLSRSALDSTTLDWRLDGIVGVMVWLLLVPPAVAWIMLPWQFARRQASWSVETSLWLAIAACGLAWSQVFLDGGARLGAVAKLAGGVTAFFLSPAVGVGSLVVAALSLFRKPRKNAWTRWLAVALGLVIAAGWGAFLFVMLPLRF